ncbi:MAG: hypothetical protein ACJAVZ_004667 [Afipia broomeae]
MTEKAIVPKHSTWSQSVCDFFFKWHGRRGNRIAQRGQIPVNLGAAPGRIAHLLDIKDVRTVFGTLEFVEVFKILFHESAPPVRFAGIWTAWEGARGTKANPIEGELSSMVF